MLNFELSSDQSSAAGALGLVELLKELLCFLVLFFRRSTVHGRRAMHETCRCAADVRLADRRDLAVGAQLDHEADTFLARVDGVIDEFGTSFIIVVAHARYLVHGRGHQSSVLAFEALLEDLLLERRVHALERLLLDGGRAASDYGSHHGVGAIRRRGGGARGAREARERRRAERQVCGHRGHDAATKDKGTLLSPDANQCG